MSGENTSCFSPTNNKILYQGELNRDLKEVNKRTFQWKINSDTNKKIQKMHLAKKIIVR